MIAESSETSFGKLFKTARTRAGFVTLDTLGQELIRYGLIVDPSLLSHWQRGARLPRDRQVVVLLLTLLVKHGGVRTADEANQMCEAAGMGFLTEKELFELFPKEEIKKHHQDQPARKLNVYFTAAIIQAPQYGQYYQRIIDALEKLGHQVQHEQITLQTLDRIITDSYQDRVLYYQKLLNWISTCDVVVAEASFPSTVNIGHEITLALNKDKHVVVFFNGGSENFHVTRGLKSEKFFLLEYTEDNLEELVEQSVAFVQEQFI